MRMAMSIIWQKVGRLTTRLVGVVGLCGVIGLVSQVGWASNYQVHKLDNGLTVIVAPKNEVPFAYLNVTFYGGAAVSTKEIDGLVHYLEHIILKATKLAPNSILYRKKVDQLGITDNGTTGPNHMDYFGWFPSAFLDEVVEFYASIARSPKLNPDEVEKERTVILDEYNAYLNKPLIKPYFTSHYIMTGGQLHTAAAIGADKQAIIKATPETLWQVYDKIVAPSNTLITLVGDFTQAQGIEVIKKYFGDWKDSKGFKPVKNPPTPDYFTDIKRYNFSHPKNFNAEIGLKYRGPNVKTDDYDYMVLYLLDELITHSKSRFYQQYIKSGRMYYSGVYTSLNSYVPEVVVYASVKPDEVDQVIDELYQEMKLWLTDGYFIEEQLDDLKRNLTVSLKRQGDNFLEFSRELVYMSRMMNPDYYATAIDMFKKISVADVHKMVKKYFIGKNHHVFVSYNDQDAQSLKIDLNGDEYFEKNIASVIGEVK